MSDPTHLLIAFAAGSTPAAQDALKGLRLPHLQALLNRLQAAPPEAVDERAPELPHERALARILGLDAGPGRTPWAAHQLRQAGFDPGTDAWAWITPCHWKVGMDHMLMQDPAALGLAEDTSRTLLDAMAPFFAEDGLELRFETPGRWLARGELFRDLVTASLDRVSGRDVAPWMPESPQARTLHRLQSEMQMLLYTHPVNDVRAAQGLAPVNSFWVSGAGALPCLKRLPADPTITKSAPRQPPGGHRPARRRFAPGLDRLGAGLAAGGRHTLRRADGCPGARPGRAAHAVRRTRIPDLRGRAAGPFPEDFKVFWHYPSVAASEFAMKFTVRDIPPRAAWALEQAGVHPLLARLFAARGVLRQRRARRRPGAPAATLGPERCG